MLFNHIQFNKTPISIIRDDLYPIIGGGNKARKLEFIARDIEAQNCNAIVTTGGIQSNHCRVAAVIAASKGWRCKLILHGDRKRFYSETGNAAIIRLSGAEVIFSEPSEISLKMDEGMTNLRRDGYRPYYVYGGGHEVKGGEAYVEAVKELYQYCQLNNCMPDYIFLPSGTGSTHGGILAGLNLMKMSAKVYGISIARPKQRAETVVSEFYSQVTAALSIIGDNPEVIVTDSFLSGGYEVYNDQIKDVIIELAQTTGIYTDPTYTGKAFWGMMEIIKKENLSGNIFFWHTGGLNNLLSSNLL